MFFITKFYISDLHFGHTNIIAFDKRPFSTAEEMDEYMIQQWNSVVGRSDEVYIIGDMFMGHNADAQIKILNRLNGMKFLIEGNHDKRIAKVYQKYQHVSQIKQVKDGLYKLFLCHYPVPVFDGHYHDNVFHLYGHVHNSHEEEITQIHLEQMHKYELGPTQMLNVGAMMPYMNYTPKTFEQLKGIYHDIQVGLLTY